MPEIPDLERLSDYVFHYADVEPDWEVLVGGNIRWTYAGLARNVDQLSRSLLAMGVEHGDRVAIMGTARPECFTMLLVLAPILSALTGSSMDFTAAAARATERCPISATQTRKVTETRPFTPAGKPMINPGNVCLMRRREGSERFDRASIPAGLYRRLKKGPGLLRLGARRR